MTQTELWSTTVENYKFIASFEELLMHAYNDHIVEQFVQGTWRRIATSSILARSIAGTEADINSKALRVPFPSEVVLLVECEAYHELVRWYKPDAIPGPQWTRTGRYVQSAVLFK